MMPTLRSYRQDVIRTVSCPFCHAAPLSNCTQITYPGGPGMPVALAVEYVHDDRSAEYHSAITEQFALGLQATGTRHTDRRNAETATEVKDLLASIKTRLVRNRTLELTPGNLLELQRAINLLGGDQ